MKRVNSTAINFQQLLTLRSISLSPSQSTKTEPDKRSTSNISSSRQTTVTVILMASVLFNIRPVSEFVDQRTIYGNSTNIETKHQTNNTLTTRNLSFKRTTVSVCRGLSESSSSKPEPELSIKCELWYESVSIVINSSSWASRIRSVRYLRHAVVTKCLSQGLFLYGNLGSGKLGGWWNHVDGRPWVSRNSKKR
jgi:hypothetical protein